MLSDRRAALFLCACALLFSAAISVHARHEWRNWEVEFMQGRIQESLERVRTILDNDRLPKYAGEVPHQYDDKYKLADALTNTAIAATKNTLDQLTVNVDSTDLWAQLTQWHANNHTAVTLRFTAAETCEFVRKTTREVDSATKTVTQTDTAKTTSMTVTTVTEYVWKFGVTYDLYVYRGSNPEVRISLQSRSADAQVVTAVDSMPYPSTRIHESVDVNLNWLLDHFEDAKAAFAINRTHKNCFTPLRNDDATSALEFFGALTRWAGAVQVYFENNLFKVQNGQHETALSEKSLFVPVLPLFENVSQKISQNNSSNSTHQSPLLSAQDIERFLAEQVRSIEAKTTEVKKALAKDTDELRSAREAMLAILLRHMQQIASYYQDAVDGIESMLHQQLVKAVGKEIDAATFGEYMIYHNRKMFRAEYAPKPFSLAVRRPEHYPEGVLSIEEGQESDPIYTIMRQESNPQPMHFALNAATNVELGGDRYLHGWVSHQFTGEQRSPAKLVARARQFSCFVMMVGRIASAKVFEPKHAIIVRNRDELSVPLMLEQIPTPKQFADMISSLSPEQQRFAKALRSMQLESTLFGVCIIQIKPQLEKLLNLPDDSLTKEIQLTQDLLDLFIDYQIPSDLLSYAGENNEAAEDKLNVVKKQVQAMQTMIQDSRTRQLEEQKAKKEYARGDPSKFQQAQFMYMAAGRMHKESADGGGRQKEWSSFDELEEDSGAPNIMLQSTLAGSSPDDMSSPSSDSAPLSPTPMPTTDSNETADYTRIPAILDSRLLSLDSDGAVRPTIIHTDDDWRKTSYASLLAKAETVWLENKELKSHSNKAFDLLDALSRSGALSVDHAALHVILAATHNFDQTLLDTVVQKNANPIEHVERSMLIVAATIHNTSTQDLLDPTHVERVSEHAPHLF